MTVAELVEEAKALTSDERESLIQQLILMQARIEHAGMSPRPHWGQALCQLLGKAGLLEVDDPTDR